MAARWDAGQRVGDGLQRKEEKGRKTGEARQEEREETGLLIVVEREETGLLIAVERGGTIAEWFSGERIVSGIPRQRVERRFSGAVIAVFPYVFIFLHLLYLILRDFCSVSF